MCIRSGALDIEWEIPQKPQFQQGIDPSEYISPDLTNTLRDGIVESGVFHQEIERIHGQTGILVHNAIIESLRGRQETQTEGFKLIYSSGLLRCVFENLRADQLEKLKHALAWVALLIRLPLENKLCVSRGHWDDSKFSLLPLCPVDWNECCFRPLFDHGIVATSEQIIPIRPLLRAALPVLYQLTGVNYPVKVKQGFILHGVFSVMVPVKKTDDGIVWHVELNRERTSMLHISEVECLKKPWHQTLDLKGLLEAPALLGWAESGTLHLGTVYPPPITWSIPTDLHAWNFDQLNLQGSIQIPNHLTLAISGSFHRLSNRLWLGPPDDFAQLLENSHAIPYILYVQDSKRGWLVTQDSVLHEMVLAYANLVGHQTFPQAMTSSDSVTAIASCQDETILTHGTSTMTVKDLILRFATLLALVQPTAIRGGKLYGHRIMDIVRGMYQLGCDIIPLKQKPCWTPLLKEIPCLVGSNFGNVITGNRAAASTPCNVLAADQNFLATCVRTINMISSHSGQRSIDAKTRALPGGFWTSMNAFGTCNHMQESQLNCWVDCSFVQAITRKPQSGGTEIPSDGVVVFGAGKPNWLKNLFST